MLDFKSIFNNNGSSMFSLEQIEAKKAYLTMLITLDDIDASTNIMTSTKRDQKSLLDYFRSFRFLVISINNFNDNLNQIGKTLNTLNYNSSRVPELRKSLNFIKHIRNKGVGHLDAGLLEKSIQWQPALFSESMKGEIVSSSIYGNIAILELAINSYVDESGEHKIFSNVIDFVYPPDFKKITDYMLMVSQQCIDYMAPRLQFLEESIKYNQPKDILHTSYIASNTDFNLKESVDYSYDKSSALKTLENGLKSVCDIIESEEEKEKIKNLIYSTINDKH